MRKLILFLVACTLLNGSGCAQSSQNKERVVGSGCEDCDMMFEGMPQNIFWQTNHHCEFR